MKVSPFLTRGARGGCKVGTGDRYWLCGLWLSAKHAAKGLFFSPRGDQLAVLEVRGVGFVSLLGLEEKEMVVKLASVTEAGCEVSGGAHGMQLWAWPSHQGGTSWRYWRWVVLTWHVLG
jgi:hypothetical protein